MRIKSVRWRWSWREREKEKEKGACVVLNLFVAVVKH
jgi:hypothetical protein